MKVATGFILIMIACLIIGCNGYAYEKNLNGGYYLDAVDEYEEMAIGVYYEGASGIGVIKATVFAVGQNDDFIIAKQHPLDETRTMNKAITNYFIIPLSFKISKSPDNNYFGPLSYKEFNNKKRELGIKNIEFATVLKELE